MNPTIRIEVDHMRQSMVHAFSEHLLKMDTCFQQAIAEATKPEVIQKEVNEAARKYLAVAIDEEIKAFLLYGDGRKIVRAEVQKRLNREFSVKRGAT